MGYWKNLWDAFLGREPVRTPIIAGMKAELPEPEPVVEEPPKKEEPKLVNKVVNKKPRNCRGNTSSRSLKTRINCSRLKKSPLTIMQRQMLGDTYNTLSTDPKDLASVCDVPFHNAQYAARVLSFDPKWSKTVELSQYMSTDDLAMCYSLYRKCGDTMPVEAVFGLDIGTLKPLFDKMTDAEKRQAEHYITFSFVGRGRSVKDYLRSLGKEKRARLLTMFRKMVAPGLAGNIWSYLEKAAGTDVIAILMRYYINLVELENESA